MDGESSEEGTRREKSPANGVRGKAIGLPSSTRLQRNQAEKQRRDRLNGYITELASLVPMVSNATKPLDKVSILRLAAAQMRLNFSCLNPKRYKCKTATLPPSIMSYLDVIEKTVGGFILVTTFSGCIVFCSKSIEDYVGYQNIDLMGNSVFSYIHNGDATYFEKKVQSVISHQQNGVKRTKVIKAHMQQRPLPRSNDVRYRKMVFKLSVHVNDSDSNNRTVEKIKKKGRSKDFGTSAVVLMFVEPVRLEPEIDISYIEAHQDAYFTMHGPQGDIIYADQRISSITGYMPHDVQGTSAYQYICSSDVPIAQFAQKAMFTSSDGTGVIVYRLKIRDMRYIYLQSSGQIAYKNSTSEISHFVCFNKLLCDEDGCQELKKFKERFAPQIVAASAAEKSGEDKTVLGSPMSQEGGPSGSSLLSSETEILSPQINCSSAPSSERNSDVPSASRSGDFTSPANSIISPMSVRSEVKSTLSPSSDPVPPSGSSEALSSPLRLNGRDMSAVESQAKKQFDSSLYVDDSYRTGFESYAGFSKSRELEENGLVVDSSLEATDRLSLNLNELQSVRLNGTRQENMHSVNACDVSVNNFVLDSCSIAADSMEVSFREVPSNQIPTSSVPNPFIDHLAGNITVPEGLQGFAVDADRTMKQAHSSSDSVVLQNAAMNPTAYTEVDLRRDQNYLNSLNGSNFSSLNGLYNTASRTSLSEHPKELSGDSGYCDASELFLENGLYQQNNGYIDEILSNNLQLSNNISTDVNGYHPLYQNGFCHSEMNGYGDMSEQYLNSAPKPPDLLQISQPAVSMNSVQELRGKLSENVPRTVTIEHTGALSLNGSSDTFSTANGQCMDVNEWNYTDIHLDNLKNIKADVANELYNELDLFFQSFPGQSSNLQSSQEATVDFPEKNSISSLNIHRAKANYQ